MPMIAVNLTTDGGSSDGQGTSGSYLVHHENLHLVSSPTCSTNRSWSNWRTIFHSSSCTSRHADYLYAERLIAFIVPTFEFCRTVRRAPAGQRLLLTVDWMTVLMGWWRSHFRPNGGDCHLSPMEDAAASMQCHWRRRINRKETAAVLIAGRWLVACSIGRRCY